MNSEGIGRALAWLWSRHYTVRQGDCQPSASPKRALTGALRGPLRFSQRIGRSTLVRTSAAARMAPIRWRLPPQGRVGACGDNAAMESFFALLQRNVLDRQRWTTRQDLRLAIITWIEKIYHRRRRQRRLGRLTPIEFETMTQTAHAA